MKTKLSLSQFVYTTPSAGVNSLVLSYEVPLNTYAIIDDTNMMNLKITAQQVFTYDTAQSGTTTVTVNSPVSTVGNIYTGGTNYNLSALGYWTAGGNTVPVQPSNIVGNTISFPINDSVDTSGTLTVYYTPRVGSYSWVVVAPTAASTISSTVLQDTISNVNSISQSSAENGLYFPRKLLMTEHFSLQLWVVSSVVISMNPASLTTPTPNVLADAEIPAVFGQMSTLLSRDPKVKETAVKLLEAGS